MMNISARIFTLTLWFSVGVVSDLIAAEPAPVNPGPAVGIGPGAGSAAFQDTTVKILGNVASGPPLAPLSYTGFGPPIYIQPQWGPRSYTSSGKLVNFSFRGFVGSADQMMIGGFVIGEGGRVVLIRAVGPTLSSFGVTNVLARPQLELFDSAGKSVTIAVPWSSTSSDTQAELRSAAESVRTFPLGVSSQDQVLLVFLAAGAYTCVVSGRDGTSGAALLEGYEIPNPVPTVSSMAAGPARP